MTDISGYPIFSHILLSPTQPGNGAKAQVRYVQYLSKISLSYAVTILSLKLKCRIS